MEYLISLCPYKYKKNNAHDDIFFSISSVEKCSRCKNYNSLIMINCKHFFCESCIKLSNTYCVCNKKIKYHYVKKVINR